MWKLHVSLAFRFRVATPQPLTRRRAATLAFLRAIIGVALIAGASVVLAAGLRDGSTVPVAWIVLVAERSATWLALGYWGAHLRGRRLIGWTISGVGIDIAFDVTVAASVIGGSGAAVGLGLGLIAFLVPLFLIGRRPSLKARFLASNVCRACGYDLAGNVSGVCPECGTVVGAQRSSPRPA